MNVDLEKCLTLFVILYRSSLQDSFYKKVLLRFLQNSWENNCAGVTLRRYFHVNLLLKKMFFLLKKMLPLLVFFCCFCFAVVVVVVFYEDGLVERSFQIDWRFTSKIKILRNKQWKSNKIIYAKNGIEKVTPFHHSLTHFTFSLFWWYDLF